MALRVYVPAMRVQGVVGVVVVVACLVAGCTPDEPDPTSTASVPTTSTTTEPTTSTPTVAVPELPEAATVGDAAGAEAFVKHWVDVLNYAYATGDTEPVQELSLPVCELCSETVTEIEDAYGPGGHIEGGVATVTLVRSPPPDADGVVSVSVLLEQAIYTTVALDGTRTKDDGAPPQNAGFVLDWIDDSWQLVGIGSE